MGDAARVIMSKAIIREILDKDLAGQCVSDVSLMRPEIFADRHKARVGEALYAEMEKLAQKYPDYVQNLRGKGKG